MERLDEPYRPDEEPCWESEAKRYCQNSDYWRGKFEDAENHNFKLQEKIEQAVADRNSRTSLAMMWRVRAVRAEKSEAKVKELNGVIESHESLLAVNVGRAEVAEGKVEALELDMEADKEIIESLREEMARRN